MKLNYLIILTVLLGFMPTANHAASTEMERNPDVANSQPADELLKMEVINDLYRLTFRGDDIVLFFKQTMKLRVHTKPNSYGPYIEKNFGKGTELVVKPGQWVEHWTRRSWANITDADNR